MSDTHNNNMELPFRRVAVLGAGTMGAQIAAHLANAGLAVDLMDIPASEGDRDSIVKKAFKRMTSLRPAPLFSKSVASRIRLGNFEDHLDRLADADWVIEAIVERLDVKKSLFERVESVVSDTAIISTNTSGIPIRAIAEGRSKSFRARFLGTHFFNPPRYLKLFEVIPGEDTDEAVLNRVTEFARIHLGKGVVVAKDSPYFIGNRIGIYAMMLAMKERSQFGFTMQEVDVLTGTLVGHPKSATFRTADVVGLDVMKAVISNLRDSIPHDESRDEFMVPDELENLLEKGYLGAKTRAGYYRKEGKTIRSFDPESGQYRDAGPLDLESLSEIKNAGGLRERLRALFVDQTRVGQSFRRTTLGLLAYAARRIPEVSDSPADIDNAIKWGFGWELGPFEIWDALGHEAVLSQLRAAGLQVPEWITTMNSAPFYKDGSVYEPGDSSYKPLEIQAEDALYSACTVILEKTEETTLRHLTDDVAILEFTSKANTLGRDVVAGIARAVRKTELDANLRGLVIANTGSNFSAGANLAELGQALLGGQFQAIEAAVRQFQEVMEIVRNSKKPVVVAAHARVLGGATELMMSSRSPVAVSETYMGLVELGVGLIPAGTGCLRLMENAARQAPNGHVSEIQAVLQNSFQNVAMASVASSALEAVEMGFLPGTAPIVMCSERRFAVAAREVVRLSENGYLPPVDADTVHVLGAPGRAAFESMAYQMHQGRFISDYDLELAARLAHVFTGGDLAGDQAVPRQHILDLERETFLSLLGESRTQDRIRHILETGKPLRN